MQELAALEKRKRRVLGLPFAGRSDSGNSANEFGADANESGEESSGPMDGGNDRTWEPCCKNRGASL